MVGFTLSLVVSLTLVNFFLFSALHTSVGFSLSIFSTLLNMFGSSFYDEIVFSFLLSALLTEKNCRVFRNPFDDVVL